MKLLMIFCMLAAALPALADDEPLWNFGAGISYTKIEHYPGSKDFSWIFLPLPVVEYRGRFARADESDGARIFFFKEGSWELDMSGGIQPGQSFTQDDARDGMDPLPWQFELGPQLVNHLDDHFELRFGAYPVFAFKGQGMELNGQYYETRLVYRNHEKFHWPLEGKRADFIALSADGASSDFMSTYYEVRPGEARGDRPAYAAKPGLLFGEFGFYEAFAVGFTTLYFGSFYDNYGVSVNKVSPLMQVDHNVTFFMALVYTFRDAKTKAVDLDKTEGVINHFIERP